MASDKKAEVFLNQSLDGESEIRENKSIQMGKIHKIGK